MYEIRAVRAHVWEDFFDLKRRRISLLFPPQPICFVSVFFVVIDFSSELSSDANGNLEVPVKSYRQKRDREDCYAFVSTLCSRCDRQQWSQLR